LGSFITTKLGGYTTRAAFLQVLIVYMILLVASLLTSFVKSFYAYGVCLWFIIFVFGYTEPILMGIMLNMVSPPERSTAISVTTFLMMTFGPLPAPYVYGEIHERFLPPECPTVRLSSFVRNLEPAEKDICKTFWAMRIVSFITILGGISLLLSFLFRKVSQEAGTERVK
jgi:MFS family permease